MPAHGFLYSTVLAVALKTAVGDDPCHRVDEVRSVAGFDGVHADDGIKVRVSVSPRANTSLRVSANANFLPQVTSRVDHSTLMLGLAPGKRSSCVDVELQVPKALLYASASGGAEMKMHSVAGSLAASSGGELYVEMVATGKAVSIVADTGAEISVGGGKVDYLDVTCNNRSSIYLGGFKARRAVAFAAGKSSIDKLTADSVLVSASGESEISVAATEAVILMCSSSEIEIQGGADVISHASSGCEVKHNGGTQLSPPVIP